MGWDGMGWDGMGWDGMGWDGIGYTLFSKGDTKNSQGIANWAICYKADQVYFI